MSPDDPQRPEFDRRRRQRNLVTALALFAMVALFYFMGAAKLVSEVNAS